MNNYVRCLAVASLICLTDSCASTPPVADNRPRFHEVSAASVVLEVNSPDCIFLTHPDYRDNGYMHILKRGDLGPAFNKLGVHHDLAVVALGWDYDPAQTAKMIAQWKSILAAQGFQRIVCVHTNSGAQVDGSIILDDSHLPTRKPLLSQNTGSP